MLHVCFSLICFGAGFRPFSSARVRFQAATNPFSSVLVHYNTSHCKLFFRAVFGPLDGEYYGSSLRGTLPGSLCLPVISVLKALSPFLLLSLPLPSFRDKTFPHALRLPDRGTHDGTHSFFPSEPLQSQQSSRQSLDYSFSLVFRSRHRSPRAGSHICCKLASCRTRRPGRQ